MSLLNHKLLQDTSRFKNLFDNYKQLENNKERLEKGYLKELTVNLIPLPINQSYYSDLPTITLLINKDYIDVIDKLINHLGKELTELKDKIKRDYGLIKTDIEEEFAKLKIKS